VKTALDAINTIVVTDDALVVEVQAHKRFGDQPKLVATIIPLDAVASNSRANAAPLVKIPREGAAGSAS
jgi:hypothetical protein